VLEALLSGVSEPEQLAELAKGKMLAKIPQLREALQSRFKTGHYGIMVAQLIAHIDTLDHAILMLDEKIEQLLAPHAKLVELLCTIPGVALRTAQVLIAECGLDMSRFPTAGHLASCAGICPGHNESAGRRRSGRTRPGPKWLTDTLTEAAKSAARTRGTYFAAHFAQLRGRRGEPKAIGATRHDNLIAYYYIVRDEVPFRELSPDWLRRRYSPEHRARRLQQQLEALGYKVTLEQTNSETETVPAALTPNNRRRSTATASAVPTPLAQTVVATRGIHTPAAADVGVKRPLLAAPGDGLSDRLQGVVSRQPGSEPVAGGQEESSRLQRSARARSWPPPSPPDRPDKGYRVASTGLACPAWGYTPVAAAAAGRSRRAASRRAH
jgi:Transposase IS116/IS110/IS902 family